MSVKYKVTVDGTAYTVEVENLDGDAPLTRTAPAAAATPDPAEAGAAAIEAPMPGKVLDVKVSVGAAVKNGDLMLILEAMNMENEIFSAASGTVKEVLVKSGDPVNSGDILIVIE